MQTLGKTFSPRRFNLLGCPLDLLSPEEVLSRIYQAIRSSDPVRVEGLNISKIIQARRDQILLEALNEAEIVHLDGVGAALGGRILGYPMPPRRTGCDLMLDLMPQASREGYRVYFLGATAEVVSEMADKLRSQFAGLQVVGARDGYFKPCEESAVVHDIQSKSVDLLFVGISSPKKEAFVRRWWQMLGVKVSLGVGGSFDVLAGRVKRAPEWVQHIGLEWLFRLLQEPRRMAYRYLTTNTIFAALLLREVMGRITNSLVNTKDSHPN